MQLYIYFRFLFWLMLFLIALEICCLMVFRVFVVAANNCVWTQIIGNFYQHDWNSFALSLKLTLKS